MLVMLIFLSWKLTSPKKKSLVPCLILLTSLDQKLVVKFVGLKDEYEDSSEKHQ